MGGGHNSPVPTEILPADPSIEPGASLLTAMVAEVRGMYAEANPDERGFAVEPDQLRPPDGAFLIIREDGEAVACGGVKRWEGSTGEIKRMYVTPAARSRGHARRLLEALEAAARELGYERVRLDTGARQPHALALYESAGFSPIEDYNGNRRASYWLEKAL
jgi:GNAT superfamily N-acetyltransferase